MSIVLLMSSEMLESLSIAKKQQLEMITTKMILSNQGLIATSWIILFLKGFVTDKQHKETVA